MKFGRIVGAGGILVAFVFASLCAAEARFEDPLTAYVLRLYRHVLLSEPDPEALSRDLAFVKEEKDVSDITKRFLLSAEFLGGIGEDPYVFVVALYNVVLNRAPDHRGLISYLTALEKEALTYGEAIEEFFNSREFARVNPFRRGRKVPVYSPGGAATLKIKNEMDEAQVVILDGFIIGSVPPESDKSFGISEGDHRVVIKDPYIAEPVVREFKVKAGEEEVVEVSWF